MLSFVRLHFLRGAAVSPPCRGFIHAETLEEARECFAYVSTPCRGFIHAEEEIAYHSDPFFVSTPCRGFIHAELIKN